MFPYIRSTAAVLVCVNLKSVPSCSWRYSTPHSHTSSPPLLIPSLSLCLSLLWRLPRLQFIVSPHFCLLVTLSRKTQSHI